MARRAQSYGARVVVDLCDDHFDTPELGPAYESLCRLADRVVASTRAMAQVIESRAGVRASIIDDPYEGPAGLPRFDPTPAAAKLLWFGHPVNFDTLADMAPKLLPVTRATPLALHVVSDGAHNGIRTFVEEITRQCGPRLTARFTPWSPDATWQALAECDLVVVPSLPAAKKQVKSPNRVVEPLRAGRFVVAYPLPSYAEFADYIRLGENMSEGVAWAIANAADVRQRLARGQAYVQHRFDPLVIGRNWEAVLLQVAESLREAA
jgi:glycosyltransferase involved in cell wall biosynthesis